MSEYTPRILIIDNEIEICNLFRDFFNFLGYESNFITDGEKALQELESCIYDVLFLDLKLDSISGLDILKRSKKIHPLAEVIVVTGFGSEDTLLKTFHYGASSYIQKPISFSDIKIQTEQALARKRFNEKTMRLRDALVRSDAEDIGHFDFLVKLDHFFTFLNLTIDIENLGDTILTGISELVETEYYTFLFHDQVNNEMVIYSRDRVDEEVAKYLYRESTAYFEKLTNKKISSGTRYRLALSAERAKSSRNVNLENLKTYFIPIVIDNTASGVIGLSSENLVVDQGCEDVLQLISGRVSYVLSNATLHRETKMLALTDGLTGLLNHRAFYERLKQEFDRYRRYGSYLSIIIADLDDLKLFNDTYGHPVGDDILRKIGEILRETTRESDVLARYGGDEFVILLPQTSARNARNMANRIHEKIGGHTFSSGEETFSCSLTIGVATVPDETVLHPEELFEKADRALYKAKRMGKNAIVSSDEVT